MLHSETYLKRFRHSGMWELAQWVKMVAIRPNNLSSIPSTQDGEEKIASHRWCPLMYTQKKEEKDGERLRKAEREEEVERGRGREREEGGGGRERERERIVFEYVFPSTCTDRSIISLAGKWKRLQGEDLISREEVFQSQDFQMEQYKHSFPPWGKQISNVPFG